MKTLDASPTTAAVVKTCTYVSQAACWIAWSLHGKPTKFENKSREQILAEYRAAGWDVTRYASMGSLPTKHHPGGNWEIYRLALKGAVRFYAILEVEVSE